MKKSLIFLLLLTISISVYAEGKVLLNYKLTKGQVFEYVNEVVTTGKIIVKKNETPINSMSKMIITNKVLDVKNSEYEVESYIKEANGFAGAESVVNQKSVMIMDKTGKIVKNVGAMGNLNLEKNNLSFPDYEVTIGDTWESEVYPPDSKIQIPIKSTYRLMSIDENKKIAEIHSKFSISSDDPDKIGGAKSVKMKGYGKILFDYENGNLISNDLEVNLLMENNFMLENKPEVLKTDVTVKTKMSSL